MSSQQFLQSSSEGSSTEENERFSSDKVNNGNTDEVPYEVELLNKEHNGKHYLKVLLLSNKVNKNKWHVPYQKISELPKSLIDSFVGAPYLNLHNHQEFDLFTLDLIKQGKSDDEIYQTIREKAKESAIGVVDHVFTENDGELLYGQVEVTDPKENEYIKQHGRPSLSYTSPALYGEYDVLECGTLRMNKDKARAWHLAAVPKPAFPEEEAEIKGVCNKGNSNRCKTVYASFDGDITTPLLTENINTKSNDINSIMAEQQSKQENNNTVDYSAGLPKMGNEASLKSNGAIFPESTTKGEGVINTQQQKQQSPDIAPNPITKQLSQTVEDVIISKDQKLQEQEEKLKNMEQLQSELKQLRKEKDEQTDFFLTELITANVPRTNFKKDSDYEEETEGIKGFVKKYNMSIGDAKWFITKAYPKTEVIEEGNKKGKGNQYAGVIFNRDDLTKSNESKPSGSGSNTKLDNEDYPILF